MNSLTKLYNKAANHIRANSTTAIFAAVFAGISTFQMAPAVYSMPQSNVVQETAFLATTGAAKFGVLYGGFLLGAAGYGAARRRGIIKGVQNDQLWSSVSSSVGGMLAASMTFNMINGVAFPLLADNHMDTPAQQEQQYAAAEKGDLLSVDGNKAVYYNMDSNTLTIA